MRIFDCYRRGCVELWGKEHGLSRVSIGYPPSFYLHLKDPHAHVDMLEVLESRYRAEECRFRTIFGELEGYRIQAGRMWPRRSSCRHAMPQSFTMWMSAWTSGTWLSRTSFPAARGMNPGSRPISRCHSAPWSSGSTGIPQCPSAHSTALTSILIAEIGSLIQ